MSQDTTTQENAVNNPETTENKAEATTAEATIAEATMEEKKPTVGLDKFLDLKKENKQLKNAMEDLKQKVEDGASKTEVSKDVRSLADEHGIDPEFLEKFASTVRREAMSGAEEVLRPLTEREAAKQREEKLTTLLSSTLKDMPEYNEIVNPDVIKQLASLPQNSSKTMRQLIEETYGAAPVTRKTPEPHTTHEGAPTELDYERAKKDTAYFKQVMADPKLKKEYNEQMFRTAPY